MGRRRARAETWDGNDDTGQTDAALADIRAMLAKLGIAAADLTTELYTDAVMSSQRSDW